MSPAVPATPGCDPDEVVREYRKLKSTYEEFSTNVRRLLETLVSDANIGTHAFEARAKEEDSFRKKIISPNKWYRNPLEEITDLAGIRVIVYYPEDVDRVASVVRQDFAVDREASGDTRERLGPKEFGYRSIHLIVSLSPSRARLREWRLYRSLRCEIQIRTVLQHAWAAIEHELQYKHEEELPEGLSRRFFRLAALLELADEEFATIREEHRELTSLISKETDIADFSVDRLTLKKYLTEAAVTKEVAAAAEAAGFSVHDADDAGALASLAWTCKRADISRIAQLDSTVRSMTGVATEFLESVRRDESWGGTLEFFVNLLVIGKHSARFSADLLTASLWKREKAERVLEAASRLKTANQDMQRSALHDATDV